VWSLLRLNQEPLLAGTAVALVVLAGFMHCQPSGLLDGTSPHTASDVTISQSPTVSLNVPRDPAYYSAKWRKIATEFYAAHPVDTDKSDNRAEPSGVVTASLSDAADDPGKIASGVVTTLSGAITTVSHVSRAQSQATQSARQAVVSTPFAASKVMPGKFVVAAALVAGAISFLLFRKIWPSIDQSMRKTSRTVLSRSDALRIELPAHWISVRPSFRDRLKPFVLTGAYITSGMAAWSIYF
jgi:hypothetical protein